MTTGTSFVPVLIVILIMARTRKIIDRFKNSGSTNPQNAKTLQELNLRSRWIVSRMVRRNLIVETQPGKYYLQENMINEYYQKRRKRVIVVLMILLAFVIIDVYFTHYF